MRTLRNDIDSRDPIVSDIIREEIRNARIKLLINEEFTNLVNEKEMARKKTKKKDNHLRNIVMDMLKDGKYKDSYLAYKLWKPKDKSDKDTYRSLFSKKANGTKDNDGNIRSFNNDEILKLYNILMAK